MYRSCMHVSLLEKIDKALAEIRPMAAQGWPPAQSIQRQLECCRLLASDQPHEPMPGPFSMGLIATREFDMYGSDPELAGLINDVQELAEALLGLA